LFIFDKKLIKDLAIHCQALKRGENIFNIVIVIKAFGGFDEF